ncbi:hypothetical protein BD626DRAFT_18705 [Schizophyllum amplum]|uniref:Uncharacterized protein n=1 Tax=Schizophyllum amplum TaxID=97359 RepID=A0A550CYD5_9AGAR|nr:hypothetical protein BD626DRAFT_18705 [Auriculariopsis ampla]
MLDISAPPPKPPLAVKTRSRSRRRVATISMEANLALSLRSLEGLKRSTFLRVGHNMHFVREASCT